MIFPVDIHFYRMPESKSIKRQITRMMTQLGYRYEGIEECRVLVELPHHHRYKGNLYHLSIELKVPDKVLAVTRQPGADGGDSDIHAVIRDAIGELIGKLDGYIQMTGGKHVHRSEEESPVSVDAQNADSEDPITPNPRLIGG